MSWVAYDDAVIRILRELPFYGSMFSRCIKVFDDKLDFPAAIEIGKSNGKPKIHLNRKMIHEMAKEFDIEERTIVESLVLHELDHYVLGHVFKRPKNEHMIWNLATDSTINGNLQISHLCTPVEDYVKGKVPKEKPFVGPSKDLENPTAEEVYDHIRDMVQVQEIQVVVAGSMNKEEGKNGGSSNGKSLDDHGKFGVPAEIENVAEEIARQIISEAVEKNKGNIPGHLSSRITQIMKPKINWKKVLRMFFGNGRKGAKSETFKRRSRRFPDVMAIPGKKESEVGKVGVAIDTSGSVSDEELSEFFAEIDKLSQQQHKITLIQYDAQVQSVDKYRRGKWKHIKIKGRGGTDMTTALNKAIELGIKRLVVFTDGYDAFPHEYIDKLKLLFVLTKNHSNEFKDQAKGNSKVVVLEE